MTAPRPADPAGDAVIISAAAAVLRLLCELLLTMAGQPDLWEAPGRFARGTSAAGPPASANGLLAAARSAEAGLAATRGVPPRAACPSPERKTAP